MLSGHDPLDHNQFRWGFPPPHNKWNDINCVSAIVISSDTIEEKIQGLQIRKRELAETFVSSNNPLKNLSEDEILELFS